MGGLSESNSSVFSKVCGLDGGLLLETRVFCWSPWEVWKWWDSWSFWWAEGGGESVHLGVLAEDGNVVVPDGLGGVVLADFSVVGGSEGLTSRINRLDDGGWDVSDDSEIVFSSISITIVSIGGS